MEVDFRPDCFTVDETAIHLGNMVDEGTANAVLDKSEGLLRISGDMLNADAGKGFEVPLAIVYFKPTPGDSVLERDTDGHYLSPVADAGFHIAQTRLLAEEPLTVCSATIGQHGPVPLWPVVYDLNGDSVINLHDVSQLLMVYRWDVGSNASPLAWAADFDRSGTVDIHDFSGMLAHFRWQKGYGDSLSYPVAIPLAYPSPIQVGGGGGNSTILIGEWDNHVTSGTTSLPIQEVPGETLSQTSTEISTTTPGLSSGMLTIDDGGTDVIFSEGSLLDDTDLWCDVDLASILKDLESDDSEESNLQDEVWGDLDLALLEVL